MKRFLVRVVVISAFAVFCFVGGILLVNFVMGYMVGRGDEIVAPDLRGMNIAEARRFLQERNLTLTISDQRFSDRIATDGVVEQDPMPGRTMKRTRPIEVTTSLGPELAAVPDLRGVALSDAADLLRDAGLTEGDVEHAHVNGTRADDIAFSRPGAGESVRKGTPVTLLVSDGPPPVDWVMPDLRGRPEARARATLETLGLSANVMRARDRSAHSGTVIQQDPSPGERVVEGGEVELVIAP